MSAKHEADVTFSTSSRRVKDRVVAAVNPKAIALIKIHSLIDNQQPFVAGLFRGESLHELYHMPPFQRVIRLHNGGFTGTLIAPQSPEWVSRREVYSHAVREQRPFCPRFVELFRVTTESIIRPVDLCFRPEPGLCIGYQNP